MLVLHRNITQAVVVGGTIRVVILAIEGNRRVKLGIVAPPEVTLVREELIDRSPRPQTPSSDR